MCFRLISWRLERTNVSAEETLKLDQNKTNLDPYLKQTFTFFLFNRHVKCPFIDQSEGNRSLPEQVWSLSEA